MKESITHLLGAFFLCILFPLCLSAQQQKVDSAKVALINIRGTVFENETLQPLQGASVKLFDAGGEKMVTGNSTLKNGQFLLPNVPTGSYMLKVSFMGFKEQSFKLTLPTKAGNFRVNDVLLREEATLMKEAVVEGQMPEMTVSEDTVIYNADAFKLPEGSMVEDLVKKLPGIMVDEDGNYTWNGKAINQILVDGKRFFGNNRNMVLKNLPSDIVDKVKAYDRQSDNARITGIDDGNEQTVLDLAIKKDKKRGWFGNGTGAYGTSDRYNGRVVVNRFKGDQKFEFVGNGSNTEGDGMTDKQSAGFTMNFEKPKVLEVNGGLDGDFQQSSQSSSSNRQSFESQNAAYSNSRNSSGSHSNSANFHYNIEWKPDTMTNIRFAPNVSYRENGNHSNNESATFKDDPYSVEGITDPLSQLDMIRKKSKVNHRLGANHSSGESLNASGSVNYNRRFNKAGRNFSAGVDGGYSTNDNSSDSYSQVDYYQKLAVDGSDSIYHKTQFNDSQSKNYNISSRLSYSEPIGNKIYLQLSYNYSYRFTDHDRTVSSIFDPFNAQYGVEIDSYRDFSAYGQPDTAQCNYTTNKYQNHNANAQIRINRTQYQLTIGGNVQPQVNSVDYNKGWKHYEVSRTVVNASPSVNFRYRFSRQEQLNFRYGGSTGQPNITDLIPDTLNNANPLNIQLGNPNLKPSFTQNLNADYRKSIVDLQRSYSANVQFRTTQNSVSNCTEYNEETGGRVTRPENINGNWNGSAGFNFNTAFKDQRFKVNSNTQTSMANAVSYIYKSAMKETVKNRTRGVHASESVRFTFRNDWLEFNVNGSIRYNHSRSTNSSASNLDTYVFNYGASTVMQFPWNMDFSTDISQRSRRGYTDASMNTNELIWGFQISQRLLPKKNMTISLRANDILNQIDNVNRNINATSRTDTRTESVHAYYLLTLTYRFGKFGGRGSKGRGPQGDEERGGGRDFGGERRGPGGGGPGGGRF